MKKSIDIVFHGCENELHYLKYGILSVKKFAPWIRKIHVIYDDLRKDRTVSLNSYKTFIFLYI